MTTFVDLQMPDEGTAGGKLAKSGKKQPIKQVVKQALKVQLERRKGQLNIDRLTWWPNWMDLGSLFRPHRGRWLLYDQSDTNKGWRRNWQIVDSTPLICNNTCAAGMLAGTASPARVWFRYKLDDDKLMEAPGVKEWLDQVTKVNRSILGNSNFYNELFVCLGEFAVFGTMALGKEWGLPKENADPNEPDLPHFQAFTIGSYYIANDKKRRVNTFFRDFKWTVQQIVGKFATGPLDKDESWQNISARTRALWDSEQYDTWIDLTHAIDENTARAKGSDGSYKLTSSGMRFRSVYYERGGEPETILKNSAEDPNEDKNKTLRVKGFRDFPVLVVRWYTNSEDAWGRGPAMDALGDARALQLQQKRKAQAIDKLVDPPMKADPSLRNQRTSLLSGDVTYVNVENGKVDFEPVYEIKPDLQWMIADIKETQERIKTVMYADIFAMFIQAEQTGQPITAAEVNAKQQEKLLMLGPVLEQMNFDLFNPLHEWLFAEGLRHGKYPPIPPGLKGAQLKVEYSSILAQAINSITVSSIKDFLGIVADVAKLTENGAQNPALDKVDFDTMLEEAGTAEGIPPAIIRSDADVEQIRHVRDQQQQAAAKQQAMQAQAEAMAQHAKTAQSLSQTPVGNGGNALDALASAVGASPVAAQ